MPVETRTIQQAYKFALAPTSRQARMFASHAGAARFAFNWGHAQTIEALDAREAEKASAGEAKTHVPSHFDLCKAWTVYKDETTPCVRCDHLITLQGDTWVTDRDAAPCHDGAAHEPLPPECGRCGMTLEREWIASHSKQVRQRLAELDANLKRVTMLRKTFLALEEDDDHRAPLDLLDRLRSRIKEEIIFLAATGQCCQDGMAHQPLPGIRWVDDNFVGTYQAALRDSRAAWQAFFDSKSGKRKGRRVGRPRFKSRRRSKSAFQVHGGTLQVVGPRAVKLPKIGTVRTGENTRKLRRRLLKGTARIVRGTISLDSAGRWHIALTVEIERQIRTAPSQRQRDGGAVGVDIGTRHLVVLSNGDMIENPRHLDKALRRLRSAQQALSRCADASAGREHARRRVAKMHNRIANLRRDGLSKAASHLVHAHELIALEGWDVQQTLQHGSTGLPKHIARERNRALAGAGLGELRWMIESRASWYGADVKVADRHQETGRTCAACETPRTKAIPPAEDQFRCLTCGHVADRRMNTAQYLVKWARRPADAPSGGESRNGRGGDVRPAASRRGGRSPTKRQASTRPRRGETGTPGP